MVSLTDAFLLNKGKSESVVSDVKSPLTDQFLLGVEPDLSGFPQQIRQFNPQLPPKPEQSTAENVARGVVQGVKDVGLSVMAGAGHIDEALFAGGADRNRLFKQVKKGVQGKYEEEYGDSTASYIGRLGGQVLATAPIAPVKAVQGAAAAVPIVRGLVANKLGRAVLTGAAGGAAFGAGTAGTNERSTASNIGEGTITGALTGPVMLGAGQLAGKGLRAINDLWANVDMSRLASVESLPLSAVKNIIARLEDVGLTPQQAQAELNKLGPKATLMDLDRALTTEGSGLASIGGKPTAIIKGRMDARAETANSDAVKLFERKFGSKPDINVESGKLSGSEAASIDKTARSLTSNDYELAHASTDKLGTSGLVQHIDTALESSVGREASALKEIKSYLFKSVKDKDGNITHVLKDSVKDLHKVRQGIDDIINTRGDALPPNAQRSVSTVRDLVDTILKTNPQMASADAKFAQHMNIKEGLKIGHDVIVKGMNKEEFKRMFDAASPEIKETIKKGMRAATGNLMEKSAQGELTGAQRLFDKKAVNRANFKHAFGKDAEEILDALHQSLAFRNTERAVSAGSQTAERQAVQARYGERPAKKGETVKDIVQGAILDSVSSGLPIASTITASRRALSGMGIHFSHNRLGQLIEGTADIISRSEPERNAALSVASRVKAVQDAAAKRSGFKLSLPVQLNTAKAPIGEESYSRGRKKLGY